MEPKEMIINLEDYIGKTVEVELRNGDIKTGKVDITYGVLYITGIRKDGATVEFHTDGTSFCLDNPVDENLYDIVKIRELKPNIISQEEKRKCLTKKDTFSVKQI